MAQPYLPFRIVLFIYSSVGNINIGQYHSRFKQHFLRRWLSTICWEVILPAVHPTGSLPGSTVDIIDETTNCTCMPLFCRLTFSQSLPRGAIPTDHTYGATRLKRPTRNSAAMPFLVRYLQRQISCRLRFRLPAWTRWASLSAPRVWHTCNGAYPSIVNSSVASDLHTSRRLRFRMYVHGFGVYLDRVRGS